MMSTRMTQTFVTVVLHWIGGRKIVPKMFGFSHRNTLQVNDYYGKKTRKWMGM